MITMKISDDDYRRQEVHIHFIHKGVRYHQQVDTLECDNDEKYLALVGSLLDYKRGVLAELPVSDTYKLKP